MSRIRVLGGGWYGSHLTASLLDDGHHVELHELSGRLFNGASGNIPARLHLGAPHYPRSHSTRRACIEHNAEFMDRYGFLTRGVRTNIYAIAQDESLVDFGTYRQIMRADIECVTIHDPAEYGLANVEGAMLTAERHILCDAARDHFTEKLAGHVRLNTGQDAKGEWDFTIDATFCANSAANVDRYEPCLVLLMEGRADTAISILDGPFPSLYPWDEARNLCSLSSAKWTPFSKDLKTYAEARALLDSLTTSEVEARADCMVDSMRRFYPAIDDYKVVDHMLSIRAMPLSGADARLVDVQRDGDRLLRVRAGKIDAVLDAERQVKELIGERIAA